MLSTKACIDGSRPRNSESISRGSLEPPGAKTCRITTDWSFKGEVSEQLRGYKKQRIPYLVPELYAYILVENVMKFGGKYIRSKNLSKDIEEFISKGVHKLCKPIKLKGKSEIIIIA